jgi:DNA-binding SARP family transcriptional activator
VAFHVLGPLQVLVDGLDVTPSAPKERALLGMLVVNHGRVVSADRIIEELWPKLGADRARRVVQVRVAEVRRLLKDATGVSRVQFVSPGYRLEAPPDDIDEQRVV